jgi:hypothetical protein
MTLTQDRLKSLLHYDPDTGVFTNKVTRANAVGGEIAGYRHYASGHWYITVDYKKYKAHRLAWLYYYGIWPEEIDHINGNGTDNRITNLRECTHQQNGRNTKLRIDNTSGKKGVYFDKKNRKYRAYIGINGKNRFIGSRFDTVEEAIAARNKAEIELFGEFRGRG